MKIRITSLIVLITVMLVFTPCVAQTKIISVSAYSHVLALNDDGTVWAWGNNQYGQLGIGIMGEDMSTPQKVLIDNVTAVSAGFLHSLALKNDGTVWAWGHGEYGELGDGGNGSRSSPVQVKGLTDIVAIAAAGTSSFALKKDGTVWAWGNNEGGYLGDGTTEHRSTPVQVKGLTDIKALGERGLFAIKDDGTVYTWGSEIYVDNKGITYTGAGGLPGPELRLTPCQVEGVSNVKQITSDRTYGIFVKDDGTVWAWGSNSSGELGDGIITLQDPTTPDLLLYLNRQPVGSHCKPALKQTKISDIIDLSTCDYHSVALKNDGTVWFWGHYIDRKGSHDNAGLPPTYKSGEEVPVRIDGLDHVVDVSAGYMYAIALKDDGSVWGWGRNDNKELGDHKIVEPHPVLIFQEPVEATQVPTVIPSIIPDPGTTINASQTTIAPTPGQAEPVPTPGFTLSTIILTGCVLVAAGLLYMVRRMKGI